ncbi:MAG: sugar ABC transporter ATP-binding protein [Actinobacteria bacterium]|nr:sugar ABC transporter ATP-binding protein [Actinomycetota bacterium]
MGEPVLSARGISKSFAGRTVLRDFNLDLSRGEVHALLGQNGSGKSTFIKILSGYHAPDDGGSLRLAGEEVKFPMPPGSAAKRGLAFVHQDLGLFETGSVLENIRLTQHEVRPGYRIPWREERRRVREALARFDLTISPDALVSSLREVDRAQVAIVRAVEQLREEEEGILILDEATAYLPQDGTDKLFASVREVVSSGFAVLFVTHRLEEVWAAADNVSVLRDGAIAGGGRAEDLSEDDVISLILGFPLTELYPEAHHARSETAARVSDVSGGVVRGFSADVGRGEILGLTGLLGMGWEEIPYLLFGADQAKSGSIELGGRTYPLESMTPRAALDAKLALLPANRLQDGAVGEASVRQNVTLPTLSGYFQGGRLRARRERRETSALLERFQVNPPESEIMLATLSGGNQQKVLLAKWFATDPSVFLLHEPTQGVDVGSRKQIFALINEAAEAGKTIVLASSEYEDLAHLCDRVLVFRNGLVTAELTKSSLSEERIVEQCFRDRSAGVETRG